MGKELAILNRMVKDGLTKYGQGHERAHDKYLGKEHSRKIARTASVRGRSTPGASEGR